MCERLCVLWDVNKRMISGDSHIAANSGAAPGPDLADLILIQIHTRSDPDSNLDSHQI